MGPAFDSEGYDALEVLAAPLEELLEARAVLAGRLALADQRRVRGEHHTLLHAVVLLRRDLRVLELNHTNNKEAKPSQPYYIVNRLGLHNP